MDTMVISPDSTIEKQKNQHTHNFGRTAPQVRSFLFGSFNYAPRANHRLRHTSKKTSPASLSNGKSLETKRFKPSLHLSFVSISVLLYQEILIPRFFLKGIKFCLFGAFHCNWPDFIQFLF